MTGHWVQVASEQFEYRKDEKLYGKVFKNNDVYRAEYLKDGAFILIPDSFPSAASARFVVEGACQNADVAETGPGDKFLAS